MILCIGQRDIAEISNRGMSVTSSTGSAGPPSPEGKANVGVRFSDGMKSDQTSLFLESPSQANRLTAPFDKGANQMPPLSKGGGPSVRTVVGFKERRISFYMIFIRII